MLLAIIICFIIGIIIGCYQAAKKRRLVLEQYPKGWYGVKGFEHEHYFGQAGGGTSICGHVFVPQNAVDCMQTHITGSTNGCPECQRIYSQL